MRCIYDISSTIGQKGGSSSEPAKTSKDLNITLDRYPTPIETKKPTAFAPHMNGIISEADEDEEEGMGE